MSVFDLRQWLADAEQAGELQHILGADSVLDIGAASQLNYRRKRPRALLFDEIAGHAAGQRVLTSSLSSPALMGMSLTTSRPPATSTCCASRVRSGTSWTAAGTSGQGAPSSPTTRIPGW
jgi:3-polyprenyl-4-hydroxybenzoate decarboxylase